MEQDLLGPLRGGKVTAAGIVRFNTVKALFNLLVAEPLSRNEIGALLDISPSAVRKHVRLLLNIGVIEHVNPEANHNVVEMLAAVNDPELVREFIDQFDRFLVACNKHVSGVEKMPEMKKEPEEEIQGPPSNRLYNSIEYAPGRTIYSPRYDSSHSVRADRTPVPFDAFSHALVNPKRFLKEEE